MNLLYLKKTKRFIDKKKRRMKNRVLVKISPVFLDRLLYRKKFKRRLELNRPMRFTDKLIWLKLFDMNENKINCTDKYSVREYVKLKGLEHILVDLYGVYEKVKDVNFEEFPEKFALKCTHGCAYNIICTDKANINQKDVIKKLNKWMKEKFGCDCAEWHYDRIKPRIICERFIEDSNGEFPVDYKIHCLNGVPRLIQVITGRYDDKGYYILDVNWERVEIEKWNNVKCNLTKIEKPEKLDEMLDIAKKLSSEFKYVRVDLYLEKDRIIFGELTFTPATCKISFEPDSFDFELGKLLELRDKGTGTLSQSLIIGDGRAPRRRNNNE